jgi:thiol peroxidase
MPEVANLVTMKGNPVTLVGNDVQVGQPAPNFTAVANDLSTFDFSSLKGKKVIISAVPSLDTPICDLQTKRFNQEAGKLGSDVVVLTISMDLPFAQKRWCGATGSTNVKTISDHRDASFANAYGLLVKGIRLLSRAIFVIDGKGVLRYKQIVPEITTEPNYDDVLKAVKNL